MKKPNEKGSGTRVTVGRVGSSGARQGEGRRVVIMR